MSETLTVRSVPAELHERLKRRAEAHRRSLDDEVVALLESATAVSSEGEPGLDAFPERPLRPGDFAAEA